LLDEYFSSLISLIGRKLNQRFAWDKVLPGEEFSVLTHEKVHPADNLPEIVSLQE
jgi:hypothetical protein